MKFTKFLLEYIKSPRNVGAISPSSEKLAEKMIESIDFENTKCIVEYGPGTGVFTDKLVKIKNKNILLMLIENNKEFCKQLEDKYNKNDNVVIINDSAENIDEHLIKYNIKK